MLRVHKQRLTEWESPSSQLQLSENGQLDFMRDSCESAYVDIVFGGHV